jgi:undecaprenol kinase
MITRYLQRFPHAIRGITYALVHDVSFRSQFFGGGLVVACVIWYASPLTHTELLFLFLSYCLILITELQNSAAEITLDHLHPERHPEVGKSKDMAAGAVLVAGFFFAGVVLSIVIT